MHPTSGSVSSSEEDNGHHHHLNGNGGTIRFANGTSLTAASDSHGINIHLLKSKKRREYEAEGPAWFNRYFAFVERRSRWIFAFWVVMYVFGLVMGPRFLKMGNDGVSPPHGSKSWHAQKEFEYRFDEVAHEVPLLILVRANKEGDDVTSDPRLAEFAGALKADILDYNRTQGKGNVLSMMSYYELDKTLLDAAKRSFVSGNEQATFIALNVRGDRITAERYDFVIYLNKKMKELNPDPSLYFVGLTGFDALGYDSSNETAEQVVKIDIFTIPIAMCLLGAMIHSWRLLLLSSFNLGAAILISFAIMALVVDAGAPHPESASAQLMEVITMSISIDWSLFLQRRFRDEVKKGARTREAAYKSLLHSGHVVVMSGMTLVVVFLGFLTMPAATVQMDGACCCVGECTCIYLWQ